MKKMAEEDIAKGSNGRGEESVVGSSERLELVHAEMEVDNKGCQGGSKLDSGEARDELEILLGIQELPMGETSSKKDGKKHCTRRVRRGRATLQENTISVASRELGGKRKVEEIQHENQQMEVDAVETSKAKCLKVERNNLNVTGELEANPLMPPRCK